MNRLCKVSKLQTLLRQSLYTPSNLFNETKPNIEIQEEKRLHIPVMVEETLKYINLSPGNVMVDMTFGAGGHSTRILETVPNVKIFALDRDPAAHENACRLAEKYPNQVVPLIGKFSELSELLSKHNVKQNSIDAFLFDLGASSIQFDTANRGFSISKNGPLDMRMDGSRITNSPTAADVLEKSSEHELSRILKYYGEENRAKQIARAIVDSRYTFRSLRTTQELAQLIQSLFPSKINFDKLGRFQHPATKTFQALRIFVNNELNEINYAMLLAQHYLKIHGRLISIAFHSLEDTVVKRHLSGNVSETIANRLPLKFYSCGKVWDDQAELQKLTDSPWRMLHKHILLPSDVEVQENPRARSAKFRALVRV